MTIKSNGNILTTTQSNGLKTNCIRIEYPPQYLSLKDLRRIFLFIVKNLLGFRQKHNSTNIIFHLAYVDISGSMI